MVIVYILSRRAANLNSYNIVLTKNFKEKVMFVCVYVLEFPR